MKAWNYRKFSSSFLCALFVVLIGRPALAVYGAEWFWTTEGDANPVTYQDCLQRAPGALATTGVASGRNGNFFYVDSPDFHVVLLCINRPHGMNMVLEVAVAGGSRSGSDIGNAINDAFWRRGTAQSGSCATPVGTWNWWNGSVVTYTQGGGLRNNDGLTGNWTIQGRRIRTHWANGSESDQTFSDDGRTIIESYQGALHTITRSGSC